MITAKGIDEKLQEELIQKHRKIRFLRQTKSS